MRYENMKYYICNSYPSFWEVCEDGLCTVGIKSYFNYMDLSWELGGSLISLNKFVSSPARENPWYDVIFCKVSIKGGARSIFSSLFTQRTFFQCLTNAINFNNFPVPGIHMQFIKTNKKYTYSNILINLLILSDDQ